MNIFFLVGTKKGLKAAVYRTSLLIRKASELISSTFRFFLQDKTYNCSFAFVSKMA